MEIHTARLVLREYLLDDWEAVHRYNSDAYALRYEAWGPHNPAQTKAFIEAAITASRVLPRIKVEMAVCLKPHMSIIGGCGLRIGERKKGMATLGYVFHPHHWGKGFATEAAHAMIGHARSLAGVHTVFATCDSENIASKRVLEKCGFEAVGMLAELEMVKGRFRDMLHFELKL